MVKTVAQFPNIKKNSEKYSESRQTSKMELFAKIVNGVQNSVKCLGWSENS